MQIYIIIKYCNKYIYIYIYIVIKIIYCNKIYIIIIINNIIIIKEYKCISSHALKSQHFSDNIFSLNIKYNL